MCAHAQERQRETDTERREGERENESLEKVSEPSLVFSLVVTHYPFLKKDS